MTMVVIEGLPKYQVGTSSGEYCSLGRYYKSSLALKTQLVNVNKCHTESEILKVKVAQSCPTVCDSMDFSMDLSMEFSRPEYLSR